MKIFLINSVPIISIIIIIIFVSFDMTLTRMPWTVRLATSLGPLTAQPSSRQALCPGRWAVLRSQSNGTYQITRPLTFDPAYVAPGLSKAPHTCNIFGYGTKITIVPS